jgi:hypothetical protein
MNLLVDANISEKHTIAYFSPEDEAVCFTKMLASTDKSV